MYNHRTALFYSRRKKYDRVNKIWHRGGTLPQACSKCNITKNQYIHIHRVLKKAKTNNSDVNTANINQFGGSNNSPKIFMENPKSITKELLDVSSDTNEEADNKETDNNETMIVDVSEHIENNGIASIDAEYNKSLATNEANSQFLNDLFESIQHN